MTDRQAEQATQEQVRALVMAGVRAGADLRPAVLDTWTVSTAHDGIVGRAASLDEARRGCLNDMGRTLIIHDPIGRVRALYRDGREICDE